MKKSLINATIFMKIITVAFLLCTNSFAQQEPTNLLVETPINSQIVDGKPKQFTIQLAANQTAIVEVEYQGAGIAVIAYNPGGERFITNESPTGGIGKKLLFVTAENAGIYRVEIAPSQPIPTKFRIEITGIRETNQNDKLVNETLAKINVLVASAKGDLRTNQTVFEQRKTIENRREIIGLSKIIGDKFLEARSLVIIGSSYQNLGDMQAALDAWLKAREIYRGLNRPDLEGLPVLTIGSIYLTISESDKAIEIFTEAQELFKTNPSPGLKATILGLLASAHYPKGEYQKAIDYANQALIIYSGIKLKVGEITMFGLLGTIYQDAKQSALAIENIEKALLVAEGFENSQIIADLQIRLGILYLENGRKTEADARLLRGKEIAERVGQTHLVVQSLYYLAVAENERGNLAGAILRLEKGIEMIEKIRSGLQNKSQRASYFSTVQDFYELYADLLIKRSVENRDANDIARSFEVSERSRSRSLIDLLQKAKVEFKQSVDVKLLEKEIDIANEINSKYQTRERLIAQKSERVKIDEINTEIKKLEFEAANLNLQIRRENPRYADLINGKTLSTKDVQKLLDDETVLLEYKLGEKRSFLWLVTKDSIKYFVLPKRVEIETDARNFYDSIVRNERTEESERIKLSRRLNDVLFAKVKNEIKGKRIAIVADGILQYLPFSALQDADSYLVEKNEIVALPSASVLAQLRANPNHTAQNKKTIAIFADPVFDIQDSRIAKNSNDKLNEENTALTKVLRDFRFGETLPRLLASRQEARNISNLVNKTEVSIRTDFEANLENIKTSNLKNYRILHFATHGLLNSNRPELSGLVFSLYDKDGKKQNGFLSLNDIYNLDLSSDLIVLSACQTALGKDVRGEGLIGISRGFLYAGSNRIVASLWKVDDAATSEFMKRFYTNHLQKGISASKALQQTKTEMKEIPRYKSPYYWSAFTLLGEWK